MATFQAGRLNSRISIFGVGVVDDPDYGPQPGVEYVVAGRIAAEVQDVLPSKAESVQDGLAIAKNRTRIRMRYRTDIDSSMTVTVHGAVERTLEIIGGPAILGNRTGIEIMCEEISYTPEQRQARLLLIDSGYAKDGYYDEYTS